VVNEALLVRKDIDVGWIFLGVPSIQNDSALFDR